jgi:hypothetical protein
MSDQPNRPWREGSSKAGQPGDAKKPWSSRESAAAGPRKHSRKRFLIAALVLGILAALGGFIFLATRPSPPKAPYLVLIGADYLDNQAVPPNPHGWQSLEDLKKYAADAEEDALVERKKRFHLDEGLPGAAKSSTFRERLLESLKNVKKEKTVIVYLALHGGADAKGAYLVPSDYDVYPLTESKQNADRLLRVSEILDALATLRPGTNKVLILDATQITAHWPLGMLHNDFARQLKSGPLKDKIDGMANLMVLCASDEGQRSWTSDEWGRTVFGHYVIEGLKGAVGTNDNQRITAKALVDYVQKNVQNWVRANRGEEQKPLLLLGKDADLEKMELVAISQEYKYEKPRPQGAALDDTKVQAKLEAAWKACDALQQTAPATYSPQLWRRYLDTLLRSELLLKSGYLPEKGADVLLANLKKWEKELKDGQRLPSSLDTVLSSALPMHAALGRPPRWKNEQLSAWAETLGDLEVKDSKNPKDAKEGKEESLQKVLEDLQKKKDQPGEALLRVQLASLVLERAQGQMTTKGRKTTREKLQLLYADGEYRPAEVHYLLMLHQDLNLAEPDVKLLRDALALRLLAENVALTVKGMPPSAPGADSSRIHPWIAKKVEAADNKRYLGQDLLFGADGKDWAEAGKYLETAQQGYDAAHQDAEVVRAALTTRDQALAKLPYYSRWLAQWPGKKVDLDRRIDDFVKLWKNAHLLAFRLQNPGAGGIQEQPPADTLFDPEPMDLKARAELVRSDLDKVDKEFREECAKLQDLQAQALFTRWHEIEAALTVPFIDAKMRLALLKASQKISKKLFDEYDVRQTAPAGTVRDAAWEARRQGSLAVAVLGQPWIDRQEQSKKVENTFKELNRMVVAGEASWGSVTAAGTQVGKLWRRLPQQVEELAKAVNDKKVQIPWSKIGAELPVAELACRQMDGAAAAVLTFDPVLESRLLLLHYQLLGQANRAWQEHWWCTKEEDAKPNKRPYYSTAVNAYLDAAEHLEMDAPGKSNPTLDVTRKEVAKKATERFPLADVYASSVDKAVDWTTERQLDVKWKIVAKGVPEGFAMVNLKTQGSLELKSGAKDDPRKKLTINAADQDVGPYTLGSKTLEDAAENEAKKDFPPKPSVDKGAKAMLQGLYRGKKFEPVTNFNLHLGADTIVYQLPRPQHARIAVQADKDMQLWSVAIILDYSNSMDRIVEGTKEKRIDVARKLLAEVMQNLPAGTKLSFWAYGHKNPADKEDKEYIEQILPPTLLEAHTKKKIITQLIAEANKRVIWWNTPLLKTMTKAVEDLKNEAGPKTMLVLTDGDDNVGNENVGPKDYPGFEKEIIDKLGGRSIAINMIIFESTPAEIKRATAQFKEPLEKKLKPAGSFLVAKDHKELGTQLRKALRPQLELWQGPVFVKMREGFEVNLFSEKTPNWSQRLSLKNGNAGFKLMVQGHTKYLTLDLGDCMQILLKQGKEDGEIHFERALISNLPGFEKKPRCPSGDWQLAVLQNKQLRIQGHHGLEMLVTLEELRKLKQKDLLEQHRPKFVWFELKAAGKYPPGLRVFNEWNRQGPAWKLHMTEWPDLDLPLTPQLDAWWISSANPVQFNTADYHLELKDRENVKKVNGKDTVTIESAKFEERLVKGRGLTKCLVVRLHYDMEGPVWAQLDQLKYDGEEHHFYTNAHKVTAVFYAVTEAQIELGFTLKLVSLDAFKNNKNTTLRVSSEELQPKLSTPNLDPGPDRVPEK